MPRVQIDRKPYSRGVTQLMYVGDADCADGSEPGCYNGNAVVICKLGLAAAAIGLLTGNKAIRNSGLAIGALGFLAI